MGSGKTCVGERLASQLLFTFQDTDQMIEHKTGTTISHVFEEKGETYFRDLETELLQNLLVHLDKSVLSTGGGLPLREENSNMLRQLGTVFYLKTSKETIISRVKNDRSRPLLQGDVLETKVKDLLTKREPIYEKVCDYTVITDDKTIDQVVNEIHQRYQTNIKS